VEQITAKDAVLLLWATCPKLEEALAVMKAWGFSYRQQIVWEKLSPTGKQNHGMGHWLKSNHELLLLGVRGSPGAPRDRKQRPHSVFRAPRREHSRKPDEVYRMIDDMFPHLHRRLELFARGEPRQGWTFWGNEVANGERS
jgi:N6-adenosine-specific RNA methylase IME4